MKYFRDQRGVALVLVVVLAAVVLVVAGLAVSNILKAKKSPVAAITPTPSASSSPTSTPDAYAGWKVYANPSKQFTIKYPSNWSVKYLSAQASGWPEYLTLGPTEDALAAPYGDGPTGQMNIGYRAKGTNGSLDDYKKYSYNTILSEQEVTINGLSGTRAEWITNTGPLAADPPTRGKGSRTVYYRIEGKNVSYIAVYNQFTSGPMSGDVLADFDSMVKALQAQ